MAASGLINLSSLIDDAKCFALIRQHRWPSGTRCPGCDSAPAVRDGHDDTQPHRGISQEKLPLCRSFFQFVHNTRKRGKSLLAALVAILAA